MGGAIKQRLWIIPELVFAGGVKDQLFQITLEGCRRHALLIQVASLLFLCQRDNLFQNLSVRVGQKALRHLASSAIVIVGAVITRRL